jgi:hypothetical protein
MFAASSTDDVLLGVPVTSKESVASCYSSKIGGSPLWISSDANVRAHIPKSCSHCNKNMLFALQIYAPTEDLERALYVYCCPSSCATQSYGWKILKDQCPKIKVAKISTTPLQIIARNIEDKSLKTDWIGLCASPSPSG